MAGLTSVLPSRALENGEAEKLAYKKALVGVTRYGLETAVDNILRGSLGHGFMPSPPELRLQIDAVMKPILEARAWDAERDRVLREQREEQRQQANSQATWTPESRQRATAKWQAIKAHMQAESAKDNAKRDQYDVSQEACMARLKAAAEANGHEFNIDNLKSAPSGTFKQAGRAA